MTVNRFSPIVNTFSRDSMNKNENLHSTGTSREMFSLNEWVNTLEEIMDTQSYVKDKQIGQLFKEISDLRNKCVSVEKVNCMFPRSYCF